MNEPVALDLEQLSHTLNLTTAHQNNRLISIVIPKSVFNHSTGLSTRLFNIKLQSCPIKLRDVMYYSLYVGLFSSTDIIRNQVESVYLDDSSPLSLNFILLLNSTSDTPRFYSEVISYCNESLKTLGYRVPDEDGAAAGPADRTDPIRPPAAKRAKKGKINVSHELRRAHALINLSDVPVYTVAGSALFASDISAWGRLIGGAQELLDCTVNYVTNRLAEQGHYVEGIPQASIPQGGNPPPPAREGGGEAANGMEEDVTSEATDAGDVADTAGNLQVVRQGGPVPLPMPVVVRPPAAQNRTAIYGFAFGPGDTETGREVECSPLALLSVTHPINRECLTAISYADNEVILQPNQRVFRMKRPDADLTYLAERYISPDKIFTKFQLFSSEFRFQNEKSGQANPTGDLEIAAIFFATKPELRSPDNLRAASTLIFDIMSRSDGRLPRSIIDSFSRLHIHLGLNNSYLSVLRDDGARTIGTNTNVIRFKNLSYSGNYLLYLMKMFEHSGSFYFHIEQLYILLALDSVCFRKMEGSSVVGMANHLICYGPPGVGKSMAMTIFIDAMSKTLKANSYSSTRSIYSDLHSSDQLDNRAVIHDECPAFIVETSNAYGGSSNEKELVAQIKERLTSGNMHGERLTRDEDTGKFETKDYNVKQLFSPFLAMTNAPEQSGPPPVLERFLQRYFNYRRRALAHQLQSGSEDVSDSRLRAAFMQELELSRTLMLLLSALQSDKIIAPPDITAFRNFFGNFILELRENPYLNVNPPTAADRRYTIVEVMFCNLVNRMAIHRMFFEPGSKHTDKQFTPDCILEANKYMAMGDTQMAIAAVGSLSHSFRSPTEYFCARMMARIVINYNNEEFEKYLEAESNLEQAKENYTRLENEVKALRTRQPQPSPAELDHALREHGKATNIVREFESFKLQMEKNKVVVHQGENPSISYTVKNKHGSHTHIITKDSFDIYPTLHFTVENTMLRQDDKDDLIKNYTYMWQLSGPPPSTPGYIRIMSDKLARELMDDQKGLKGESIPLREHIQKRLELLMTSGVRCGPFAEKRIVRLVESTDGKNMVSVFVLKDWLEDCTRTNQYSFRKMAERAVLRCSQSTPGVYISPEPLRLGDVDEVVSALNNSQDGAGSGWEDRLDTYIYQLCPSFTIPIHQEKCPARRDAEEVNPPSVYDPAVYLRTNCNCFRKTGKGVACDSEVVSADPRALAAFKLKTNYNITAYPMNLGIQPSDTETDVRVKAFEEAKMYPIDAIRDELTRQGKVISAREANAEESAVYSNFQHPPEARSPEERKEAQRRALADLGRIVGATARVAT